MGDLKHYSKTHRHVLTDELPPLLEEHAEPGVIADLGCGDGATLWALLHRGLLSKTAYGVDLSPERVEAAASLGPNIVGIVSDATQVPEIADSSVDGVVCSQVIEHLLDDRKLAPEIARILRPGGWWYVGTVLRGPRAWWIYRGDGRWQLDPTHTREYETPEELLGALEHEMLAVEEIAVNPFRFPLLDLILRAAATARIVSFDRVGTIYRERPSLARLRRIALRVPGYARLEVFGHRR